MTPASLTAPGGAVPHSSSAPVCGGALAPMLGLGYSSPALVFPCDWACVSIDMQRAQ